MEMKKGALRIASKTYHDGGSGDPNILPGDVDLAGLDQDSIEGLRRFPTLYAEATAMAYKAFSESTPPPAFGFPLAQEQRDEDQVEKTKNLFDIVTENAANDNKENKEDPENPYNASYSSYDPKVKYNLNEKDAKKAEKVDDSLYKADKSINDILDERSKFYSTVSYDVSFDDENNTFAVYNSVTSLGYTVASEGYQSVSPSYNDSKTVKEPSEYKVQVSDYGITLWKNYIDGSAANDNYTGIIETQKPAIPQEETLEAIIGKAA